MRAAIASWANVSAFDSRVGAPPTPFCEALVLRPGGIAGPPSMERTSEAAAPVTMRTGLRCTRARMVAPRPVGQPALGERRLHGPLRGLTGHTDDQGACAQRLGDQQGAVQDQVRGTVDHHRVLAAGGLVLASVDDDHRTYTAADRRLGDRPQFLVEREARAAAALQIDALGELRELLSAHRLERPVHLQVHGQVESLDEIETGGELGKAHHSDFGDVGKGLVH